MDAKQLDDEEERHEQVGRTPCLAQAAEQSEQVCPLHIDRAKQVHKSRILVALLHIVS